MHIAVLGETASTIPFTVTVTWAEAVHPFVVPITVYVVVEVGLADTLEPVELLNEADGDHK